MFTPEKQTRVKVEQRYLIRSQAGALTARDVQDALHVINSEHQDVEKYDDWYTVTTEDETIVVTLAPKDIDLPADVTADEVQKAINSLRENARADKMAPFNSREHIL